MHNDVKNDWCTYLSSGSSESTVVFRLLDLITHEKTNSKQIVSMYNYVLFERATFQVSPYFTQIFCVVLFCLFFPLVSLSLSTCSRPSVFQLSDKLLWSVMHWYSTQIKRVERLASGGPQISRSHEPLPVEWCRDGRHPRLAPLLRSSIASKSQKYAKARHTDLRVVGDLFNKKEKGRERWRRTRGRKNRHQCQWASSVCIFRLGWDAQCNKTL